MTTTSLPPSRRTGPHDGTTSPHVVRGVQVPRIMTAPVLDPLPRETAADEFIRVAELAGLDLDPWQRLVLRVALAESVTSGRWRAFEVVVLLSRQNGKGSILEALELGWLFLLGEKVLHTAQLASTAIDGYERLLELIERSPALKRRLGAVRRSADQFSITTLDKAGKRHGFALFGPRSPRLGRGKQFDKVIYDEALFLTGEETAAQIPTMSTRDNPQVWYLSSAGRVESEHLRALRDRGRTGSEGLAYFEWSIDVGELTVAELVAAGVLDDPVMWAQANPALEQPRANSISVEYIEGERRAWQDQPELFLRERLGVFDEPQIAGRVISSAQWEPLEDVGVASVGAATFGVAVNPERTAAWITVAGHRLDGIPLVEVVATAPADPVGDEALVEDSAAGLSWVIDWFAERPGARVAVPQNGPAGGLTQRLIGAGADVVKVSDQAMARASQAFYDAVVSKQLRHLGDEVLEAAVAGGRRKDLGDGGWIWHQRSSSVDIGALQGVTAALDVLAAGGGQRVYPGLDRRRHVVEGLAVGEDWPRVWAVRLGYLGALVWQSWALAPDGRLVLEHELYRSHTPAAEVGAEVAGLGLRRAEILLCDAPAEDRRSFERAAGRSAREPRGSLADGVTAMTRRLAENRMVWRPEALVGVDQKLQRAARPVWSMDEAPGYVWDAESEEPCHDLGPGLTCARWVVAHVDLRARASARFL